MIEMIHNSMFWWRFGTAFLLMGAIVSFTVILTLLIHDWREQKTKTKKA